MDCRSPKRIQRRNQVTEAKLLARTTEYIVCWKFSNVMTFKNQTKPFGVGAVLTIFKRGFKLVTDLKRDDD